MKAVRILLLILCGCLVSVAWGQQPACTKYTFWAQFHNRNMERWNPCEKALKVENVGSMVSKWSSTFGGGPSSPVVANGVVYIGSLNEPPACGPSPPWRFSDSPTPDASSSTDGNGTSSVRTQDNPDIATVCSRTQSN
jgi:hypothetical protein